LGTGQLIITVLNEKGIPTEVIATHLTPSKAVMGSLTTQETEELINNSDLFAKYGKAIDP
jgi:hypothetical protein